MCRATPSQVRRYGEDFQVCFMGAGHTFMEAARSMEDDFIKAKEREAKLLAEDRITAPLVRFTRKIYRNNFGFYSYELAGYSK